MVKNILILAFAITSHGLFGQKTTPYFECGIHNFSLLSFESMRFMKLENPQMSRYYKPKLSYHISVGIQTKKMDFGLVFKTVNLEKIERYYVNSPKSLALGLKNQSGKGAFYSLAPRFGYTLMSKEKLNFQGFVELGIPLASKLSPIKTVFTKDSVAYYNTVLLYAFDFRSGIIMNYQISKKLIANLSAYYMYMGHGNYGAFDDKYTPNSLYLWGFGGGYLGVNFSIRYNFLSRRQKK